MKKRCPYDDALIKNQIKDALSQECSSLSPSPGMKDRIDEQIRRSQEETGQMKHLSIKKVVIGVAAACLLIPGGAYAAGHADYLIGHSCIGGQSKNYSGDMEKMETKLGYPVLTVESFDNGYCFKEMEVMDTEGRDENNNKVYTYKDMTVYYGKQGCGSMYLGICKPVENQTRTKIPNATKACGDIMLYYDEYTYKSVPADYEMTPDDQANEQRDDYYISFGLDEVQIQISQGVTWEMDGVSYNLAGFDLGLSADEMFAMAEQIIENGD